MGARGYKSRFTAAQDAAIRAGYGRRPTAEIAARIGVAEKQVRNRARAMGVTASRVKAAPFADTAADAAPVAALPGSEAKIQAMCRRAARGLPLCAAGDMRRFPD